MLKTTRFLLTGAAVLTFSAAANAQSQKPYVTGEVSPLSGIYVGGFGGYSWTDADTNAGTDFNVNGGDYGLFAGYQLDTLLDRTMGLGINGAIEGHYAWSDADDSATIGGVPVGVEKDNEWGISFRPGLSFVDNAMPWSLRPYGIIGYRNAKFQASAPGISGSQRHDGFELGLGTEVVAYQDFGVRLDYSHVWYEDKNGVDPSEDDLRLGVAYHF